MSIVNHVMIFCIAGHSSAVQLSAAAFKRPFVFIFSWQRLHRELPLSAEELEDVFDSLDTDRTGYLTLEAFSSGFSRFPAVRGLELASHGLF